jgi:hypothetical protein
VVRLASALLYVVKLPVLEVKVGGERRFVAPCSDSLLHAQEVRSLADLFNLQLYAAWQQILGCHELFETALLNHFTGEELPVESRVLTATLARRAKPEQRLHPRKIPVRFTVTLRDRLWRDRKREIGAEGLIETFFARAQLEGERARLPDGTLLLPAPRSEPHAWDFAFCPELPAPEPEEARSAQERGRDPRQAEIVVFLGGGDG